MEKKHSVLVVDDDTAQLSLMNSALSKDYNIFQAENGVEALSVLKKNEDISIVITDLIMPKMGGEDLIKELHVLNRNVVIIVQTVVEDVKKIIQLMKQCIYDYIPKPYTIDELLHKVNQAVEIYELRKIKAIANKEREIRIQHQLDWNIWKEEMLKRDIDKLEANLVESIRSSFTQGAGFGAVISLIGMIKKSSKAKGNTYIVDKFLMDMLFDNTGVSEKIIKILEEISSISRGQIKFKKYKISDLYDLILGRINHLQKYIVLRNHNIKLEELQNDIKEQRIVINQDVFQKVIDELILNALKFSIPNSSIYILLKVDRNFLFLSCMNSPEKNSDGNYGIPLEMRELVFEPFFRNSKVVFEKYECLDIGLGLSYVEKAVRAQNGKVRNSSVKDYIEFTESQIMTLFEIELPIEN